MGSELHGVSVSIDEVPNADGDLQAPVYLVIEVIPQFGRNRNQSALCLGVASLDQAQDVAAHVYNETMRQINELRLQSQ